MNDNPKVSVIIPVWNPGDGIVRCVASLRNQTLKDIEMLFVDDRGTDGAMDVVRAAAAEDPRIRVITNSGNMGAGASRNAAIEVARGEYLAFVDADDYVDSDFLEILYTKGKAEDLDIVKGSRLSRYGDDIVAVSGRKLNEVIKLGLSANEPLFALFTYEFQSALYHHRLFDNPGVRFGLTISDEDVTFLLKACHAAKSFGMEETTNYHYVRRHTSAVNRIIEAGIESKISALQEWKEYLVGHVEPNPYAVRYFAARLSFFLSLHRHVSLLEGMNEAAARFLDALRDQAMSYPGIETCKEKDLAIFALIGYGENMVWFPYRTQWGETFVGEFEEIVSTWARFFASHPDCVKDYKETILFLGEDLCAFVMAMKRKGYAVEDIASMKMACNRLFSNKVVAAAIPALKRLWFGAAGVFPMDSITGLRIDHDQLNKYSQYRVDACNQLMANRFEAEARETMENLGRMLRLTPEIRQWAEASQDVEIRAAYDYGVALRTLLWGDYRTASNYLQMLSNWQAFFAANQGCWQLYYEGFVNFVADMRSFVREATQEGEASGELALCEEVLEAVMRKLPLGVRVQERLRNTKKRFLFFRR